MKNKIPNHKLRSLFQNIKNLNLLVVGDLILDKYIMGSVDRISPEAPVPVVSVISRENRIGGAGNVAANLAGLGCDVSLAGVCGADENADILEKLFEQHQIKHIPTTVTDRNTSVKSRIIAKHQQLVRIDDEKTAPVDEKVLDLLLENMNILQNNYDGIILSDYKKGLLTPNFISKIIAQAGSIPLIIDPKGHDYTRYEGATAIKPNLNEFQIAVHHPELQMDELEEYAINMVRTLKLQGIVITLGEHGVFVLDDKQKCYLIPTDAKEVFDVSGAGDTFIATFTAAFALSNDWHLAAKAGNLASGIAVGKVGTATVSLQEILDIL